MRLEWIEDILAVLDTGSFAAAAERRLLTASAFTRRIRAIEGALGAPLFDRSRKPVVLLPHVLAEEAQMRDAVRSLRSLRHALSAEGRLNRRRLTMACQHALTTTVSPGLARQLARDRDLSLRIRSDTRSACQVMLLRGDVDFALVYETAQDTDRFDVALFDAHSLGSDMFVPVAALRDHPEMVTALEAGDLPLITYPGDIYLGEVLRTQVLPGLPPEMRSHDVAETGLTPAVLQFVRQGLGMGWLPRSMAAEAIASGELSELSQSLPSTPLAIRVLRRKGGGSELAEAGWRRLCKQM